MHNLPYFAFVVAYFLQQQLQTLQLFPVLPARLLVPVSHYCIVQGQRTYLLVLLATHVFYSSYLLVIQHNQVQFLQDTECSLNELSQACLACYPCKRIVRIQWRSFLLSYHSALAYLSCLKSRTIFYPTLQECWSCEPQYLRFTHQY